MDTKGLYAIERVRPQLYVLLQLHQWVSLDDFNGQRSKTPPTSPIIVKSNGPSKPWWRAASPGSDARHMGRKSDLALSLKPPNKDLIPSESWAVPGSSTSQQTTGAGPQQVPLNTAPDDKELIAPTLHEIFDTIRYQYLDTLYVTKVKSLAGLHLYIVLMNSRHLWHILQKDRYRKLVPWYGMVMQ